jgi:hypothetical protein
VFQRNIKMEVDYKIKNIKISWLTN